MKASFKTADEAIEQLLKDGFEKVDYDPLYPYTVVYNDGDGVKARVVWSEYQQTYVIESVRL